MLLINNIWKINVRPLYITAAAPSLSKAEARTRTNSVATARGSTSLACPLGAEPNCLAARLIACLAAYSTTCPASSLIKTRLTGFCVADGAIRS